MEIFCTGTRHYKAAVLGNLTFAVSLLIRLEILPQCMWSLLFLCMVMAEHDNV